MNNRAFAGGIHTERRRIFVRLQGAVMGASPSDVLVAETRKAGEKTNQAVCFSTEVA
jgi:hypothetical protein